MVYTLELGKDGLWIGNLKLKFPGTTFVAERMKGGMALLRSPFFEMPLWSDGEHVFTSLWGNPFMIEPFPDLGWLRNWLGLITDADMPFILEGVYQDIVAEVVRGLA